MKTNKLMSAPFKWKKLGAAAAIIGLGIASVPASAATVNQIQTAIGTDAYRWEDNDIEKIGFDGNGNGQLDVGDTLLSIIEIEKIINETNGTEYIVGSGANNSLAGIAEIKVLSRTDLGGGLASFVFGAPTASGVFITFYEDALDNINITNCGASTAACIGTVTDGTKILELGFNGSPGENWSATGPIAPNLISLLTTTDVGGFNFGVTALSSSIGVIAVGDHWAGSGSLQGCTTTAGTVIGSCLPDGTGGGFTSTSDFQLAPAKIPEPGTLGLLGLGLLATFGFGRRKQVS